MVELLEGTGVRTASERQRDASTSPRITVAAERPQASVTLYNNMSIRIRAGVRTLGRTPATSSASTWARPTAPSPTSTPAPGDEAPHRCRCRSRRSSRPARSSRAAAAAVVPLPARPRRAAGRRPAAALGAGARLRRRRVRPQVRQPGADAAGRLGQVVAVPPRRRSPRADPAVEGARERPAASRRSRRARCYLKHLVEAWNHTHRQGRPGPAARTAGHRPDRAGVVRRRGPRADRRGGPRRRAGATSRCSRSRRRRSTPGSTPAATTGASRSRSATSSWSATSAAAPPT